MPDKLLDQRRGPAALACSLGVLALALALSAQVLMIINHAGTALTDSEFLVRGASIGVHMTLAAVGVLVLWRQPENRIGWLIWATGALGLIDHIATQYAVHSLRGAVVSADRKST